MLDEEGRASVVESLPLFCSDDGAAPKDVPDKDGEKGGTAACSLSLALIFVKSNRQGSRHGPDDIPPQSCGSHSEGVLISLDKSLVGLRVHTGWTDGRRLVAWDWTGLDSTRFKTRLTRQDKTLGLRKPRARPATDLSKHGMAGICVAAQGSGIRGLSLSTARPSGSAPSYNACSVYATHPRLWIRAYINSPRRPLGCNKLRPAATCSLFFLVSPLSFAPVICCQSPH